ncbi:hypothetical protein [Marinobacter persicus]|uniref:Competence protein CoiA-like family protein n=1 Tax=Marinobacter persicus TaxID=930118 RepID=A0A2S6GAG9_9GAMM|nr:hypothetical protein [Marinobacter persicus]PPK53554.1 hypothetical protein BY455_10165 [Marinobacter persicus]PPK56368.1 hypothetical protein B0H24_100165 [Marinobacter persicus]PPK59941.1 hypothetical protein BY454_10165 [Marinobacter persicus]
MTDTKIPFGYHIESGRYVDVREVPSGKKCGCKCPACDLPLVARHCQVGRVDHFAHNTRGQDKKVYEECTFSYWVSIAAMTRQIFRDSSRFDIAMPAYTYPRHLPWEGYKPDFVCTEACTVHLEEIAVDRSISGEHFDVVGEYLGVPVGVKLIHPEKKDVGDFSGWHYNEKKLVVISIDLSYARRGFQHSEIPLKDMLSEALSKDRGGKAWVYHPRMVHYLKKRMSQGRFVESKSLMKNRQSGLNVRQKSILRSSARDTSSASGMYRNEKGEYLFYCRKCDHEILKNATQCFCDKCFGVMYRIHRGQIPDRKF